MTKKVDVAILGGGTAGLSAMAQIKRKTDNFVLIDGGKLGTTCARVGCMPSKALINISDDFHHRQMFAKEGINGADHLSIDRADVMERVEDLRDILVDRVMSHSTDLLGDKLHQSNARFLAHNRLQVGDEEIEAKAIIMAVGSRPIVPAAWEVFDDKILTTDSFFEQQDLPDRIAVIGLGVIGIELGQAMARLGVEVTGIDLLERIAGLDDPEVNALAVQLISRDLPLWLGQGAEIEAAGEQLKVTSGDQSVVVDKVLASIGRRSNIDRLGLDELGIELNSKGVPDYNPHTMQVGELPLFIAGDANGVRPILHEAALDGRIAGVNALNPEITAFHRPARLGITFSDPNICAVGMQMTELDADQTVIGEFRFGALGRGLVMGNNRGILRLYANKSDGLLLGAGMVAPRGENLAHLLVWSIEQGLTIFDMLQMPFYHPVFEEAIQGALRDAIGKTGIEPTWPPELKPL